MLGKHLWTLFSHIFLTGANRISFPVHHFLAADVFHSDWCSWRTNAKFCNRLVILTVIMGTCYFFYSFFFSFVLRKEQDLC